MVRMLVSWIESWRGRVEGGEGKTYALLHEGVDLALILNLDELLAAIGRVGNVQLREKTRSAKLFLVILLNRIGWREERFDDGAGTEIFVVDRAIRVGGDASVVEVLRMVLFSPSSRVMASSSLSPIANRLPLSSFNQ